MIRSTPPAPLLPKRLTASGVVKTGQGVCASILCNTSSSLVISVYDGVSTGGTKFIGDLALAAGDVFDIPAQFMTGLYVEVVSGSGGVTVFYI